jgi:aminoglycoside phosphotransferase (APT) family kinase protein
VVAIFDRFRKKPEMELTAELVRELLRDQQPDLADRPLTLGARGWANQLWRLGDDLAVRLPWQTETADALLLKENTWLPVLAPLLPLPVPVPQRLGQPSARYPRPWIVTTWVPGTPADRAPATCSGPAADALAAFLTALHRPAPVGAPEARGTCTQPTSSRRTATSVAWSTSATCALAIPPSTWPPVGYSSRITRRSNASSRPTR